MRSEIIPDEEGEGGGIREARELGRKQINGDDAEESDELNEKSRCSP